MSRSAKDGKGGVLVRHDDHDVRGIGRCLDCSSAAQQRRGRGQCEKRGGRHCRAAWQAVRVATKSTAASLDSVAIITYYLLQIKYLFCHPDLCIHNEAVICTYLYIIDTIRTVRMTMTCTCTYACVGSTQNGRSLYCMLRVFLASLQSQDSDWVC